MVAPTQGFGLGEHCVCRNGVPALMFAQVALQIAAEQRSAVRTIALATIAS